MGDNPEREREPQDATIAAVTVRATAQASPAVMTGGATLAAVPAGATARAPAATVWVTYSWAQAWFEDALQEARSPTTSWEQPRHARRREILHAVCFAETYLFEWVRDEALNRSYRRLATYFPADARRGVTEKWKAIPKQLVKEGRLHQLPDFGGPHGEDWQTLISFRDGFVHAAASRPHTDARPPEEQPMPTVEALQQLPPGWAVRVVVERVRRLHQAAGTSPPAWLVEP